ncbi:MAG: Rha family transcriptional regulator, partial [Oscillospiraceae bacterium]|nr:Rha family transcriptional regulator [Oscillospiraceae bacterium]
MNKLVSIENRTPIEIALPVDDYDTVSSVELYNFLELDPKNYAHWCKTNIDENPFAFLDEDYVNHFTYEKFEGKNRRIYRLYVEFARKLSVISESNHRYAANIYFTNIMDRYELEQTKENDTIEHCNTIDSREVAEIIDKRHDHLIRDIQKYAQTLEKSTDPKIGLSDFFIERIYKDSTGRTLPHYLLTRKGCEFVANKMTGEKGVLFTERI